MNISSSVGSFTTSAGGVLSILRVTVAVALLFALSVTVPLTTWPVPSVVTVCAAGHETICAPPGVHVNVTVTFVLFHPAAFGAGETVAVIVGGPGGLTVTPVVNVAAFMDALTTAAPALTAVTTPPEPTYAIALLDEPQVTCAVTS